MQLSIIIIYLNQKSILTILGFEKQKIIANKDRVCKKLAYFENNN